MNWSEITKFEFDNQNHLSMLREKFQSYYNVINVVYGITFETLIKSYCSKRQTNVFQL